MQASLAVLGCVSGIIGGWQRSDPAFLIFLARIVMRG